MPSVNKRPQPITPDDFARRLPSQREQSIDQLVDYINGLLDFNASTMEAQGFLDVTDNKGSALWRAWSGQAVQRFREAGWRVAEADTASTLVYRFFMPQ